MAAKQRESAQREKAEHARDRTRQALDAMTSSVTGDSLTTQTVLSAEQKKFLTEVLTYYQEFAGEKADDEQTRARTAAAAYRVGTIEYRLARTAESIAALEMARDIATNVLTMRNSFWPLCSMTSARDLIPAITWLPLWTPSPVC